MKLLTTLVSCFTILSLGSPVFASSQMPKKFRPVPVKDLIPFVIGLRKKRQSLYHLLRKKCHLAQNKQKIICNLNDSGKKRKISVIVHKSYQRYSRTKIFLGIISVTSSLAAIASVAKPGIVIAIGEALGIMTAVTAGGGFGISASTVSLMRVLPFTIGATAVAIASGLLAFLWPSSLAVPEKRLSIRHPSDLLDSKKYKRRVVRKFLYGSYKVRKYYSRLYRLKNSKAKKSRKKM